MTLTDEECSAAVDLAAKELEEIQAGALTATLDELRAHVSRIAGLVSVLFRSSE